MNKQIKKLALQAGLEMCVCGCDMPTRQSAKFAELIVRECAKIAEDTQKFYDEHNDSVVNTEIWTMIKLHFGVEE